MDCQLTTFHTKYLSKPTASPTVRICVVMNDTVNGNSPFFGVEVRKPSGYRRFVYAGNCNIGDWQGCNGDGMSKGLVELERNWGNIPKEDRELLLKCASNLRKSCDEFFAHHSGHTLSDETQAERKCDEIVSRLSLLDMKSPWGFQVKTEQDITTENTTDGATDGEWTRLDLSNMDSGEIGSIIEELTTNGNPEDGIVHNGKRYAILLDNNQMVLKMWKAKPSLKGILETSRAKDPLAEAVQNALDKPTRSTVQMAMMQKCADLTEFAEGCYYPIVSNVHMDGREYVKVRTDDGGERTLLRSRVKVVDVYDEPPKK